MQTADSIRAMLGRIRCTMFPAWAISLMTPHSTFDHAGAPYIQIKGTDKCAKTGDVVMWTGRKWQLSYHMTDTEIVGTAYKALQAAVEHELREHFLVDDLAVYDPHRSLESMLQAARLDQIEVRADSLQGAA